MLALAALGGSFVQARDAAIHPVALAMTVTLDQVTTDLDKAGERTVGQVDQLRIVYDANAVDPKTKHVKLLNFQHLIDGRYAPPKPDPVMMPLTDAWLDMSALPYRLHFKAAVTHGTPILIDVDETTRRLAIHPQEHPDEILIAGPYVIDPTPFEDPSLAEAAGTR
ncbi:MAG TPA: hypothetical protein VNW26_11350 [Steroidobacteraceae bacterium]|nr:hypothetical protein [Steroidobacteraceae bacterium]